MRPVPLAVISKTEPFGGLPPTLPGSLTGADIERLWPQVQAGVVAIQPRPRRRWPPAATTTCRSANPTSSSAQLTWSWPGSAAEPGERR